MPSLRCGAILLSFLGFCCIGSRAQDQGVSFPTDDEIKLVLTQTDRAIDQYKPLLDMEQQMWGKEGLEAVAKDRQVVQGIEVAVKAFGKDPQAFNGPLGFTFFEWLDDASRNALLCASSALTEASVNTLAGDQVKAAMEISLSQSCMAVSTLFYTVSENAGALYTRYVEGEEKLAKEGLRVAEKCAAALKQKGISPKQ
jgi:hypothetical protein